MEMFLISLLMKRMREKKKNTWAILNNVLLAGILCVFTNVEDILCKVWYFKRN